MWLEELMNGVENGDYLALVGCEGSNICCRLNPLVTNG